MEIKKCEQCGGTLNHLRVQKAWVCPFCDARYADSEEGRSETHEEYYGLNDDVFQLDKDLSKLMKKTNASGCIKMIVHCMNTFETAKEVEEYMLKKLPFSDDIATNTVREEYIRQAMPMIQKVAEPGERVIVYGNKGIFSKGKEYFVVTDKRCIFVNKKKIKDVLHTDIDSLSLADCANCTLNGDYDKILVNLDGNGKFQGALLAMICMLALEAEPDRAKFRIE